MHVYFGLFSSLILVINFISCEEIDEEKSFDDLLKEENAIAVLFTKKCCTCTDCVEAEVLLGGMSQELEQNLNLVVARIRTAAVKSRFGIKKVPAMVYIRENKTATFDGKFEFDEVYAWLQDNRFPSTTDLDDYSFEHLTQAATGATTGDWLVLFHDGSCLKGRELMHLEDAGIKLKNKVNVAVVDTLKSSETATRFKVETCPEVIFFRHQKMYRFSLQDITPKTLMRFAEGFYKNSKAEKVPPPATLFDKVLDKTIKFYTDNWFMLLVLLAMTTVSATLLLICTVIRQPSHSKSE